MTEKLFLLFPGALYVLDRTKYQGASGNSKSSNKNVR